MNDLLINAFEFCARSEKLEGKVAIADLDRLKSVCADTSGELVWQLEGITTQQGFPLLCLRVSGDVRLVCQRCMEAFVCHLDSVVHILLARDDEAADELEAMLADDDPTEVIVGDERQNVMVLVEDEALLSLPLSPMHVDCSGITRRKVDDDTGSPFSVLKTLKK